MATHDFFRARLDQMIDLRHQLAVLAARMAWTDVEASLAPLLARPERPGARCRGCRSVRHHQTLVAAGVSAGSHD